MSIRLMSTVWSHSRHAGNDLLVMLALADNANDDGISWPSLETLGRKVRLSRRGVQNILQRLSEGSDPELEIRRGVGRGHTSHYIVKVQNVHPLSEEKVQNHVVKGALASAHEPRATVVQEQEEVEKEHSTSSADVSTEAQAFTPARSRKRDPLWDALAEELGEPATRTERGRRNAALKELRAVDATVEQLRERIVEYHHRWPDIDLTATAIVAHWTLLANGNGHRMPDGMKPAPNWKEKMREHDSHR